MYVRAQVVGPDLLVLFLSVLLHALLVLVLHQMYVRVQVVGLDLIVLFLSVLLHAILTMALA